MCQRPLFKYRDGGNGHRIYHNDVGLFNHRCVGHDDSAGHDQGARIRDVDRPIYNSSRSGVQRSFKNTVFQALGNGGSGFLQMNYVKTMSNDIVGDIVETMSLKKGLAEIQK